MPIRTGNQTRETDSPERQKSWLGPSKRSGLKEDGGRVLFIQLKAKQPSAGQREIYNTRKCGEDLDCIYLYAFSNVFTMNIYYLL